MWVCNICSRSISIFALSWSIYNPLYNTNNDYQLTWYENIDPLVHYFKNRSYRAVLGMRHWSLRIISGSLWESWGHETCSIILVLLASRNIPPKIVDHLYDIGGTDFVCISNRSMQFHDTTHMILPIIIFSIQFNVCCVSSTITLQFCNLLKWKSFLN